MGEGASDASLLYLGGLISKDGRVDSELSRRIGIAHGEFRKLKQAWGHASLSRSQKLKFFDACVISKLAYGLATVSLTKAQRRRLDGFHARCLRRILAVPAAFVSRIPNATILQRAQATPVTEQILRRQLALLKRAGGAEAGSPLRKNIFFGASTTPMLGFYVRRVGRPRADWTSQALAEAARRCDSKATMEQALVDRSLGADRRWKKLMKM